MAPRILRSQRRTRTSKADEIAPPEGLHQFLVGGSHALQSLKTQAAAPGSLASRRFSRPWVRLLVDLEKMAGVDVGVSLGGGEAGVTQELLDGPKVGAPLQKVGGEAVAKGMGADPPRQGHLAHPRRQDQCGRCGRSVGHRER